MNSRQITHTLKKYSLISVLAGSAFISLSAPTFAAFGEENGQLAFSRDKLGASVDIYALTNGSEFETTNSVKQLTFSGRSNDTGSAWSPNGEEIAFICDDGSGDNEVCIMDKNGANVRQVTNDTDNNFNVMRHHPSWSPDGQKMTFSSTTPGSREHIFTMSRDGSNIVDITPNSKVDNQDPAWSPLGNEIAFVSRGTNLIMDVTLVDTNGNNAKRLTAGSGDSSAPSWSPQGDRLAYSAPGSNGDLDIFIVNREGTDNLRVTTSTGHDSQPAWSPDGRKIAYVGDSGANYDIFVMDSNGTNRVRYTSDPAPDSYPAWQSIVGSQAIVGATGNANGDASSSSRSTESTSSSSSSSSTTTIGSGSGSSFGFANALSFRFSKVKVRLAKKRVKKTTVAQVQLQCPVQTGCSGQLTVAVLLPKGKKQSKQRSITFASKTFALKSNGTQKLNLALNRKALKKIVKVVKQNRKKKLTILVTVLDRKNAANQPGKTLRSTVKVPLRF